MQSTPSTAAPWLQPSGRAPGRPPTRGERAVWKSSPGGPRMPHAMALHLKGSEPEPVEVVGCTLAPRATASVADSASHAADALAHLHRTPVEVGRVPGRAEIRRPGRRCRSRTPRRVLRMPQFKDGNCDFHGSVPYPQLSEFQTAAVPGTHLMWGAGGEAPRAGEDVPRRLRRTVLNRLRAGRLLGRRAPLAWS
jgi:hypothetical protein